MTAAKPSAVLFLREGTGSVVVVDFVVVLLVLVVVGGGLGGARRVD